MKCSLLNLSDYRKMNRARGGHFFRNGFNTTDSDDESPAHCGRLIN
jgi:hypothetical protein